MKVSLEKIGKRYTSAHWIFKGFTDQIESGSQVAITGGNGSGKSTLLHIIGGLLSPSLGEVAYIDNNEPLDQEEAIRQINFVAPYMELIEEFSVIEQLNFHFKFKTLRGVSNLNELIEVLYLQGNEHKWVKNLSSGMKQRLKLGLGIFTKSPLILLDEPTTNLDEKGISWYHENIAKLDSNTSLIIASNQKQEYAFCDKIISMKKEFSK
ncbi:MAG: ATP-binding cassette domain-containing protein [Reichenbachiella sp.]